MKQCPTCHRPFGSAKRTCFYCRRPIARTDRWHVEGCYIAHDDCQNPTIRVLVRAPNDRQPLLPEDAPDAASQEPDETEESNPLRR